MSEELKPCPFCGQKPEVFGSLGVMCANAECALEAIAMPIEDWNRRALSLPNGPSELNVLKFLDQLGTDLTDIHNCQPGGRGLTLPPPSISPASEETQFSRLALRIRRFADELRAVLGSNGSTAPQSLPPHNKQEERGNPIEWCERCRLDAEDAK